MGYKVYAGRLVDNADSCFSWSGRTLVHNSSEDAVIGGNENPFVLEPKLVMSANDPGTLTFTVPKWAYSDDGTKYTNPYYDSFVQALTAVSVEEDGNEIFIGFVKTIELQFDLSKAITVTGALDLLGNAEALLAPKEWVVTHENGNISFENSLQLAFLVALRLPGYTGEWGTGSFGFDTANCDIAVGKKVDTSADGMQSMTYSDMVQKYLLDEYGGYFWMVTQKVGDNKYRFLLRYTSSGVVSTQQKIEYGKNLLDLTVTEDTSTILNSLTAIATVTETKGWWIFKKTTSTKISSHVEDAESIQKYGLIHKYILNDSVTSQSALDTLAQDEFAKKDHYVVPEIELKAYDQVDTGAATDRLGFMKKTYVSSPPHGVAGWYLCTKQTIPLDDLSDKEFVFGVPPVKLTKQQNQLQAAQDITNSITKGIVSYVQSTG